MSNDTTSLETHLSKLRAATPNEALLARLEACAAGTWTQLSPEEHALEQNLRSVCPAPLSSEFTASLESLLHEVEFPSDSTIVPFPARSGSATHSNRKWWAAAAAVALIGATTALMIPNDGNPADSNIAATSSAPQPIEHSTTPFDSEQVVPAGFNRDLRSAHDEGVVWQPNQKAHRVLKMVYMDRITLHTPDGKSYQIEQPRVEYILTPEQTD